MTKPLVLFVDDDPHIISGMKRQTRGKRETWNLQFALGGPEALEIIAREKVDVIVSDMRMPQVDGASVLEAVARTHPGSIRFILSGEADLEATYRTVGVSHGFTPKPCDPEVLVRRIDEILTMRLICRGNAAIEALATCLPSPAETARALEDLFQEDTLDLDAFISIARFDPALSMRMLHLVNSAYFAQPLPTADLGKAVRSLGPEPLRGLHRRGRLITSAPPEFEAAVRAVALFAASLAHDACAAAPEGEREFRYLAQLLAATDALLRISASTASIEVTNKYASGYVACLFGLPARLIEAVVEEAERHPLAPPLAAAA